MFLSIPIPLITHYWSIGVEEQFYLFWPWFAKIKQTLFLRVSVFMVLILIMLKFLFYLVSNQENFKLLLQIISVTRFHIMIIGCIGAILFYNQSKLLVYFTNKYTQFICWILFFLLFINKFNISLLIDNEIVAVMTVLIIISQIQRKNYYFDLDIKIFNFLGKISYGIYVIHPLIIFLLSKIINKFKHDNFINYLIIYILTLLITIFTSYLSFFYFESYFIKLKKRFTVIKSSS